MGFWPKSKKKAAAPSNFPLVHDGATPEIDLDYENGIFRWMGSNYLTRQEAIDAGVLSVSASGDDQWSTVTPVGGMAGRVHGISPAATDPTNGQYMYAWDDGPDGTATDEFIGLYRVNSTNVLTLANFNGSVSSPFGASTAATLNNSTEFGVVCTVKTGAAGASSIIRGLTNTPSAGSLTRNATLTRLTVGNTDAGNRKWLGTIKRLTFWLNDPLHANQKRALARPSVYNDYLCLPSGGNTSDAITISGKTYMGQYVGLSAHVALAIDSSGGPFNGQLTDLATLGTTVQQWDDHNRPSIVKSDGNTFSFNWHSHNTVTTDYGNRTTDLSIRTLQGEVADSVSGSAGTAAYAFAYKQASTGHLFRIFRQTTGVSDWGWSFRKSTDNGVTWSASKRVIQHTEQFYWTADWLDADTMIGFCQINPSLGDAIMKAFTWNVVTNEVKTLGNTLIVDLDSVSASVGANLSAMNTFKEEAAHDWYGNSWISPYQGFGLALLTARTTAQPVYGGRSYETYLTRYNGSGDACDPANWTFKLVASNGYGFGTNNDAHPGSCFSRLATGLTKPRIFVTVNDIPNNVARLKQYDCSTADGLGAWTETRTVRTVSNLADNTLFRPASPDQALPGLEVFWFEGLYQQYSGNSSDINTRLCWRQD